MVQVLVGACAVEMVSADTWGGGTDFRKRFGVDRLEGWCDGSVFPLAEVAAATLSGGAGAIVGHRAGGSWYVREGDDFNARWRRCPRPWFTVTRDWDLQWHHGGDWHRGHPQ